MYIIIYIYIYVYTPSPPDVERGDVLPTFILIIILNILIPTLIIIASSIQAASRALSLLASQAVSQLPAQPSRPKVSRGAGLPGNPG